MLRVFSICIIICFLVHQNCKAAIIRIHPSPNSIHNAIAIAKAGDTIFLQSGIYKEHNILISKRLTITGDNFPIIDAESKYEAFSISADSVTIIRIRIQNIGISGIDDLAAIKILNAGYAYIEYNQILNSTYGIYMQNANHCYVLNNTIRSNSMSELKSGNGIHGWKSDHLFIKGNSIMGHRDGIYFEFVTESQILENISHHNVRYGLHFMFSHSNTYTKNIFKDNGAGVAVMYSHDVRMYGNTFEHNWGDAAYGLLLKEISDSYIYRNHFIKNTIGIYMEGANRIHVWHNNFENNGWAMHIQASCNQSDFVENNYTGNSFDVATNGTMVLNTFKRNYWDKYEGYDMNKDNIGDVPYYPVSLYSVITEKIPVAMILYRSLLSSIMDKAEGVMPSMIPDKLKDNEPVMKQWKL